jgi:hypothetical protein
MKHHDDRLRPAPGRVLLLLAGAFGLLSCQVDSVPNAYESHDDVVLSGAMAASHVPQLLRHAPAAPPLETTAVTFVAVLGSPQVVEIPYISESGAEDGDVFLRLELGAESLLAHPSGARVEDGDAVTISMVVDTDPTSGRPGYLCATFSPSGLQFDPDHPARLTMSFAHADPDLDGDGRSDLEQDRDLISIWRQGSPDTPWAPVTGAAQTIDQAVEAELLSFSRYALAI